MSVRKAAVAGSWYPGTAAAIAREVEGYLEAAGSVAVPGRLVGIISPHAGLRYSGPVAAYGYGLLRGRHSATVVLVGPSHREAFDGVALYPQGAFETPLGPIPIAEEIASDLLAADPIVLNRPEVHRAEHSLEMQLPFLQHLVPDLRIVPLLMGTQSRDEACSLAGALASVLAGREVLLVASSDLSHYHPAPVANDLDALVVGDVERFDDERLMKRLEASHHHACGGGPMVAVMKAAKALGARKATVLRYADSGDAGEHDKSRVVGYLSAALTVVIREDITPDDRRTLLQVARGAIIACLSGSEAPKPCAGFVLDRPQGAFVTLTRKSDGELRGCVGFVAPHQSLVEAVAQAAVAAATQDGRFSPVTQAELSSLHVEVSALSPLEPIQPEKIEVGRHGLVVRYGRRQGLLLPQVATEHGWDRATFLAKTCWKAGLPEDTWRKPGVEIMAFTAEVFGED